MTFTDQDHTFMQEALKLVKKAESLNEVPVGAVLVYEDKIIGSGWNQPVSTSDPTAHAEIIAMRQGANTLNNYRLKDTTLYVTLEPCCMCAGALIHARVKRLVFGAKDLKAGACGSVINLFNNDAWNHHVECEGGLCEKETAALLKSFFQKRR